ncbi:MAG: hypothetical protein EAZ06_01460 [Cytophagales bacterium]|nr:MAG: hypothetical protein EAZ06_01460 [Cytophagales bacterium]
MNFDTLFKTIINSEIEDWAKIEKEPFFNKDFFKFCQTYNGQDNVLLHETHDVLAIYKENLSISICYGLDLNKTQIGDRHKQYDWRKKFPNQDLAMETLDIFYNNGLIYRVNYFCVDGGNYYFPINNEKYEVKKDDYDIIKFLHKLATNTKNNDNFNYAFNKAELTIKTY